VRQPSGMLMPSVAAPIKSSTDFLYFLYT
jgi:hypothetical protein